MSKIKNRESCQFYSFKQSDGLGIRTEDGCVSSGEIAGADHARLKINKVKLDLVIRTVAVQAP